MHFWLPHTRRPWFKYRAEAHTGPHITIGTPGSKPESQRKIPATLKANVSSDHIRIDSPVSSSMHSYYTGRALTPLAICR